MKTLPLLFAAACLLASCSGRTSGSESQTQAETSEQTVTTSDLSCKWLIDNIVINDTVQVSPAEISPERNCYIVFNSDGTFGASTNCNTLGGEYVLNNDSIRFTNMLITEMACDNMTVEEMLVRVLPEVEVLDCVNDSLIRLNTASSACIVLKKSPITQE